MPEEVLVNVEPAAGAAGTGTPAGTEPAASDVTKEAESTPVTEDDTILGKGEEEASGEGTTKVVVPEKYEFKLPEGVELDASAMEAVSPVFKELGISNDGAQKLVDVYMSQVTSLLEKQKEDAIKSFSDIKNEWKAETIKELGPESDKELAFAAKFINKFGGNELRSVLNDSGLGNNVHVVKAFIKAGKAFSSDSFPDSTTKKVALTDSERAKALFPTMKE